MNKFLCKFQTIKYTRFLFFMGICLLLDNVSALSTPPKQLNSESADFYLNTFRFVGSITRPSKRDPFSVSKLGPNYIEYLIADILGEKKNVNEEVTAYKWPLQFENRELIHGHHIYFFVGTPLQTNAKDWLESNLVSVMKQFEDSVLGMQYLKVSFPSFYLGDTQHATTQKPIPCIDEYRATKRGEYNETNTIKITGPFLFALIREADRSILFSRYINDPMRNGDLCPFSAYSVSSNIVSIQATDNVIPPVANQKKEGLAFFLSGFIFDAIVAPFYNEDFLFNSEFLDIPHLRLFFNGKADFIDGYRVVSIEAKTHAKAKLNRFVVFFVHPESETAVSQPFPEPRVSKLFEDMRSKPQLPMVLEFPSLIMFFQSSNLNLFTKCIDKTNGIVPMGLIDHELLGRELIYFKRNFYIFVHDHVHNKIVASGRVIKTLNRELCRKD